MIAGTLAGSGCPAFSDDLDWLRDQQVRAIISLTERSLQHDKLVGYRLEALGFICRHLPIPDETAPTPAQIKEFVAFVDEMHAQGLPAPAGVAHGAGGYGRTGTWLACYLVSQGHTAHEAITC